jgi:hypothetical protein
MKNGVVKYSSRGIEVAATHLVLSKGAGTGPLAEVLAPRGRRAPKTVPIQHKVSCDTIWNAALLNFLGRGTLFKGGLA